MGGCHRCFLALLRLHKQPCRCLAEQRPPAALPSRALPPLPCGAERLGRGTPSRPPSPPAAAAAAATARRAGAPRSPPSPSPTSSREGLLDCLPAPPPSFPPTSTLSPCLAGAWYISVESPPTTVGAPPLVLPLRCNGVVPCVGTKVVARRQPRVPNCTLVIPPPCPHFPWCLPSISPSGGGDSPLATAVSSP